MTPSVSLAELIDVLTRWVLTNLSRCKVEDCLAVLMTTTILGYSTPYADEIKAKLIPRINKEGLKTASHWLDFVWTLALRDEVTEAHLRTVLCREFIKSLVLARGTELAPTTKLKLQNLDAVAKQMIDNFEGLSPDGSIYDVEIEKVQSNVKLMESMNEALESLISKNFQKRFNTKLGITLGKTIAVSPLSV